MFGLRYIDPYFTVVPVPYREETLTVVYVHSCMSIELIWNIYEPFYYPVPVPYLVSLEQILSRVLRVPADAEQGRTVG